MACAVVTASVGITLLQMCLRRIHHCEAPISSAASTYCAWRSPRATARVTRKYSGERMTPRASIDWCNPLPSVPTTAMANTVKGSTMRVSVVRRANHSTRRPAQADATPGRMPSTIAVRTASRAPATESLAPAMIRLSTSRPM
jgi:hypothetical protein